LAKPFRWNIAQREQLGGVIAGATETRSLNDMFLESLRSTAARILAHANRSDLAFIGRTPENLYDYLSGCFEGLRDTPRLHLIQYSLRNASAVDQLPEPALQGLFEYLIAEGLGPKAIATGSRPIALVDFVASGRTMEGLIRLMKLQAEREGQDWTAVQRRLRIIGLRVRTKNSPNTWRWQQHQDWLHFIPDAIIRNVSAPAAFLHSLGNDQPKVTASFHPGRWAEEEGAARRPNSDQQAALGFAAQLYDLGRTREERQNLAKRIARHRKMSQRATRRLVLRLRGG
jgi:hypothetical protein